VKGVPARIVVVGATGIFGRRLAGRLAAWPDASLVLAARGRPALEALRQSLKGNGAANPVEIAVLDRRSPAALAALHPWAVVDCAGPFQGFDYRLAEAALDAGAHYLDLADGRAFVAAFVEALGLAASRAGRCAVTGASSSPALSHAAIARISRGWRAIDGIEVAIAPGARAPRGRSVVSAALSWVGQPVRVFVDGQWRMRPGWGLLRRRDMPEIGRRWLSLAETPDLDLQVERFSPRRDALFLTGLANPVEHLGLWGLSGMVRAGWTTNLASLAGILPRLSAWMAPLGSDRGGMSVTVQGLGPNGELAMGRWSLCADAGYGPAVPTLPAAAILRAWLEGREAPGAAVGAGVVDLEAIISQAEGLPIRTSLRFSAPQDRSLGRRLLGSAFDDLPAAVRLVHGGLLPKLLSGHARARGGGGLASIARRLAGMPRPGRYNEISVAIEPVSGGEIWTRQFDASRFRSRLRDLPGRLSEFEEQIGPLAFRFEAEPDKRGFIWRFVGWRIGPAPLPRFLAPRIAARCFERDGRYRFSVAVAHPLLGLFLAYAGSLEVSPTGRLDKPGPGLKRGSEQAPRPDVGLNAIDTVDGAPQVGR
jgi:hypothetical protein